MDEKRNNSEDEVMNKLVKEILESVKCKYDIVEVLKTEL